MGRTWLAAACAVAGVAVLAGPGWALLAAAVLIFVTPTPAAARAAVDRVRPRLVRAWRWLTTSRRSAAVATMPVSVVLVPVGVGMFAGIGYAVFVAGVILTGVSLLLGWNQ